MAYTQADLDTIDAAIATGEKVIQIEGKRIETHDANELLRLRRFIAAQLNATATGATAAVPRTTFVQHSRD